MITLAEIFEKPISGEWGEEPLNVEGARVIRTTNFTNIGQLDLKKEVVTRNIDKKVVEKKRLRTGDIIIEKSGGSANQHVGRVVYFDLETDEDYLCNNFTAILRTKDIVDSKYVLYCMLNLYKKDVVSKFQNKTTGIINLKLNDYLNQAKIPFPSIKTQKKIAEALDKAQELIDKRKEQIEKLDEFLQSVFLDMFGDPVRNPKEWEVSNVNDLCVKIVGGGTPSKNIKEYYLGDIPWVSPKDVKSLSITDSMDHITEDAVKNSSTNLIPPNSLLMVVRSGILKKQIPVAINKRAVTINQDLKAFIVDNTKVSVEYILYYFLLAQKLLLAKVRGVTADNIEFRIIKELNIPVPLLHLQYKFAQIVQNTDEQRALLKKSLAEMENNFYSIMQKAFRGELFN